MEPPGWYYAQGDPPDTQRFWDGTQWVGDPVASAPHPTAPAADLEPVVGGYRSYGLAWPRIAARIIDNVIIAILTAPFILLFFREEMDQFIDDITEGTSAVDVRFTLAVSALAWMLGFFVEAAPTAIKGASPGKLALGLRVVNLDGTSPIGWGRSIVRWGLLGVLGFLPYFGSIVSIAVLFFSLIGLLNDSRRRSAYDRVAGTYVVAR